MFVGSARAGARVMASIARFLERRMRLQVSAKKSAVRHPRQAHFLGFRFLLRQDGETDAVPAQGGTLCQNGRWRAFDGGAMGTTPCRVFLKDGVFRGAAVTGHPCRILTHCATRWSSRARELRGGTAAGLRDRLHGLAEVAPSARHESGVSRF